MLADKYAEAVRGITPPVAVKLIDGVNHMGIVSNPAAVSVVADDVATRNQLRLLEAVHHLIRPVAGVPAMRRLLQRSGQQLQKKFAAFEASATQVATFGSITRGVQVNQTPTLLVINKQGKVIALTGLIDAYSLEQAIDEARQR